MNLRGEIETAVSQKVIDITPLNGGCIGDVYRVRLGNGAIIVVKADEGGSPRLDVEGRMLQYLHDHSDLPVPRVLYSKPRLLMMDYLPGDSYFPPAAQENAAELLAVLHTISAPTFGLEWDTLIGGLHQPNTPTDSWLDFFREQRILYMAREGVKSGRLPTSVLSRLEAFCGQLDRWLLEPERPSLIHGDVWTTNVLAVDNKITGFVDPAIYYADPEIELAFTTLFGTFGEPFFSRYLEIRPLPDGFFDTRRDIYNLYPLLVHVRLFGGSYIGSVDRTLRRFGF